METPKYTTIGNIGVSDKTFNVFLFTPEEFDNLEGFSMENELQYFQDQIVEMIGRSEALSLLDIQTLFSMGLSEDQIQTIRESEYIVITSIFKI